MNAHFLMGGSIGSVYGLHVSTQSHEITFDGKFISLGEFVRGGVVLSSGLRAILFNGKRQWIAELQ